MQNGTPAPQYEQEPGSGFFGTILAHAEPQQGLERSPSIAVATATSPSEEAVRAFWDSPSGR